MQKFVCHTPFYSSVEQRWFNRGDWCLIENNNVLREDAKQPSTGPSLEQFGTWHDFTFAEFAPMLDWNKLKPGDRVLVHRIGGIGDITHAMPIVTELAERGAVIEFCYKQDYKIIEPFLFPPGCQYSVRSRQSYGVIPVEADWTVNLESCVEANMKPVPVLDLYLERTKNPPEALLDPANRLQGGKYITQARANIAAYLEANPPGDHETYDVIIASYASAPVRSVQALDALPDAFLRKHSCALIGVPQPIHTAPLPVYNMLEPARYYDLLMNAKLVVTADNGTSHIAYWLGLPMISIYAMIDWRARLYPAKHVCIVNCTDLCPMAPCWWQNMICPLLMAANEQVRSCNALLYLASQKLAELMEIRLKPGDKTFLEVAGKDLAGVPDFVFQRKGLRNADGSPYTPHA